jgi:hypothetical protein
MKYPRTKHLSISPEIHADDKTLTADEETLFLNKELIITEKLDGGNACLHNGKIYARSHSEEVTHPSFSRLKNLYSNIFYTKTFDFERYMLFGENVQAIHSIEYTSLTSPFYLFGIYDTQDCIWLSWKDINLIAESLELEVVPIVSKMAFKSIKELDKYLSSEIKKESSYGPHREGFVLRIGNSFKDIDFQINVCKFVRRGHVQSDDHWTKNWKPQEGF